MPIYEYHCKQCEKDVEVLQRSSEEKAACPECGSKKMSRLLSVISRGRVAESDSGSCSLPTGCGKPQCGMGGCAFE